MANKKLLLLKGNIATPGIAAGRAYVIKNPSVKAKIEKKIILVAPFTTPVLAPIISRAIGIITEIGGVTCHAAIISREFGIPCIVGVAEATRIIKQKGKIILDATKGKIYEQT